VYYNTREVDGQVEEIVKGLEIAPEVGQHPTGSQKLSMGYGVILSWHDQMLLETKGITEPIDGGRVIVVTHAWNDIPFGYLTHSPLYT